jgi:FAD/FMN-containing dehydrogenase
MLDEFKEIVGEERVFTDAESLTHASASWHPLVLKTRPTRFEVIVRPESAAQAREILGRGWSVAPVGGGSGTGEPPGATIGLDLGDLNQVALSEIDLTVTAGAGVVLEKLEEDLARHGYTLGQVLGSARLATVGGCVATGARGLFSGRYGGFAEITRSVEEAHGVILSATLAIRPAPEVRAWAVFGYIVDADALDALRLIQRSDARPALSRASDGRLILCFEGDETVQTGHYQLAHAICQQLGLTPRDESEGDDWLLAQSRDTLWSRNAEEGVWADRVTLSAGWSEAKEMLTEVREVLNSPSIEARVELRDPTPHGVTIAAGFVATRTTETGWRTLRESLEVLKES